MTARTVRANNRGKPSTDNQKKGARRVESLVEERQDEKEELGDEEVLI